MKRPIIGIGVAFLFLFCSSPTWAENWKLLASDHLAIVSYDSDRVNYMSNKILRVWVKLLFTEKGRQSFLEQAKLKGLFSTEYERLDHVLLIMEIDCQAMMTKLIWKEPYDRNNNKIVHKILGPVLESWEPISNYTFLHEVVKTYCEEKEPKNTLQNTLKRVADCMIIAAAGNDCNCVLGIRQMVTEGKLSPGEAQFLISQKCKLPSQQQPPQQQDCRICPICGTSGFIGPMIGAVFHYKCVMGHIWPCNH